MEMENQQENPILSNHPTECRCIKYAPVFHRIQSGNSWRIPEWLDRQSPAGRPGLSHSTLAPCCTWRTFVVVTRWQPARGWCWPSRLQPVSCWWQHGADCVEGLWIHWQLAAAPHDQQQHRRHTATPADHTLYAPSSTEQQQQTDNQPTSQPIQKARISSVK